MGHIERIFNWVIKLVKTTSKIDRMSDTLIEHRNQIESLSERVLRLEVTLQYAAVHQGGGRRVTHRRNSKSND